MLSGFFEEFAAFKKDFCFLFSILLRFLFDIFTGLNGSGYPILPFLAGFGKLLLDLFLGTS